MESEGTVRTGPSAERPTDGAIAEPADSWVADLRFGGAEGSVRAEAAQRRLHALVASAVRKATAAQGLDEATLEDLSQVATLHVLRNLHRFEGRSKFSTWTWAVAVRAAFGELRRATYREPGEELTRAKSLDLETDAAPPGRQAERQEIVEVLHRIIAAELTDRQRTAILGELSGTPQEELLATLGANRNALYKLVHDARRKLKQGLQAAGICDEQVREAFDL